MTRSIDKVCRRHRRSRRQPSGPPDRRAAPPGSPWRRSCVRVAAYRRRCRRKRPRLGIHLLEPCPQRTGENAEQLIISLLIGRVVLRMRGAELAEHAVDEARTILSIFCGSDERPIPLLQSAAPDRFQRVGLRLLWSEHFSVDGTLIEAWARSRASSRNIRR
jgi:hypothetical protein